MQRKNEHTKNGLNINKEREKRAILKLTKRHMNGYTNRKMERDCRNEQVKATFATAAV